MTISRVLERRALSGHVGARFFQRGGVFPVDRCLGVGPFLRFSIACLAAAIARQITALVRAAAQSRKSIVLPPSSLRAAFNSTRQRSTGLEPAARGVFYNCAAF